MKQTKPADWTYKTSSQLAMGTPQIAVDYYHPCPLFENPQEYLKFRRGKLLFGFFKRWSERRAIDKSLDGLNDIYTVCDAPCGPGRLFPCWEKRGYRVIGVDLSDPMVAAAREVCADLHPKSMAIKGDAFSLKDSLAGNVVDLVASVRFFYYFKKEERVELLKAMAASSRKYLLVQYKTSETRKGKRELRKIARAGSSNPKQYCSNPEIKEELEAAGLECIRIVPISHASDRVFVTARNRM